MTSRCRRVSLVLALLCVASLIASPSIARSGASDVRRLAGPNRFATAAAIAMDGWGDNGRAVLADGGSYIEALIGGHLAARLDVPLLLGDSGQQPIPVDTVRAISDLGITEVDAVGEVGVPEGTTVRSRITADGAAALAVAAIRETTGPDGTAEEMPVVLVTDAVFADALSAASLAPALVLLTAPDGLSPATRDALVDIAPAEVLVLGGVAAIAESVLAEVRRLGTTTVRIDGPTRYETALAAASAARSGHHTPNQPTTEGDAQVQGGSGETVVLASGQDWPDAVAAVPYAARRQAVLLLTPHDALSDTVGAELGEAPPEFAIIAGGTAAVGNNVDGQIAARQTGQEDPGPATTVRRLREDERAEMSGVSWRPGCPVGLDQLRVVTSRHWGRDGNVVDGGQLIVHADVAEDVAVILARLFDSRFPILGMQPVRAFGGDDDASMAADNSSAFNCRVVSGTSRWSEHAYGRAIDLNPVQNPFVRGSTVQPDAGRAFLDRSDIRPGMIVRGDEVTGAFADIGWGWGGDFNASTDYQHFSRSGN